MQRHLWSSLCSARGVLLTWILLSGWVRIHLSLLLPLERKFAKTNVSLRFSFAGRAGKTRVGCASKANEGSLNFQSTVHLDYLGLTDDEH